MDLASVVLRNVLKVKVENPAGSAQEQAGRGRARFDTGRGIFFLLGMASMALAHVLWPVLHPSAVSQPRELQAKARDPQNGARKSGPPAKCGDFEYIKLALREPSEFLPDPTRPLGAARWFFPTEFRQGAEKLFQTCGLKGDQIKALLAPQDWETVSNGFYIFPPPKVLLEMSQRARERIYSVLDDYPANSSQCHPFRFRPEGFEEWLADAGLGPESTEILRQLVYHEGGSLCFCDTALAQGLFPAADFKRLVEALYGERTFIMKVRINPQTDFDALLAYWGQSAHSPSLRPLLESMAQAPGGNSVGVAYLLPPFARLRLYTYADPANDPTATAQNCFWTAMNFFNEEPDNRFLDLKFVEKVLASDYVPAAGPPTFGDVLCLRDERGSPIHMCVYLADDVVFTKNGHDYMEPWVLMRIPDMLASYQAKEPTHLMTFRSKRHLAQRGLTAHRAGA